jgi:tetratricopeptide (TPR) repeat protein
MDSTVVELIRGLVQVRDGLSLTAFLTLVLLLALRTQKVPELFFGLVRDKLTRQQFLGLLNRFMTLGFSAFLVLVALSLVSQVLGHLTQPNALTIADLRGELNKAMNSEAEKRHAESQYQRAMDELNERNLEGAIESLKASIKAVPTLTAEEMLTYLYRQKRDFEQASLTWETAMGTARKNGDVLAQARLNNVGVPRTIPVAEGEHDLVGNSTPLPQAADTLETATAILPGFYICKSKDKCFGWFKVDLKSGQNVAVKFRSASQGPGAAQIGICGTNGESLKQAGSWWVQPSTMFQLDWTTSVSGWHFVRVDASPDTVFRVKIE